MAVESLHIARRARQFYRVRCSVQKHAIRSDESNCEFSACTCCVCHSFQCATDLTGLVGRSDLWLGCLLHLLGCSKDIFYTALEVEGLLRNVIVLAFNNLLERSDRVLHLDVCARDTCKNLGDVEGL